MYKKIINFFRRTYFAIQKVNMALEEKYLQYMK